MKCASWPVGNEEDCSRRRRSIVFRGAFKNCIVLRSSAVNCFIHRSFIATCDSLCRAALSEIVIVAELNFCNFPDFITVLALFLAKHGVPISCADRAVAIVTA